MSRLNGTSLVLVFAFAALTSGCSKLKEGVVAYYQGDYPKAIQSLNKIAAKAAKKDPSIKVSLDDNTSLEQALPHATKDAFDGWQAYAGSHFALGRIEEGCKWTKLALRPIRVKVNHKWLAARTDPREGQYWQAEVMSLRAWENNIPCP